MTKATTTTRRREKSRPKHRVVHNYHDHANMTREEAEAVPKNSRKGGVSVHFPVKLHQILDRIERDGMAHIIAWQPHGRCFVIHKPRAFANRILPE